MNTNDEQSQVPVREQRSAREWQRDVAARKVAGVCAGLAAELGVSVTVVRTAFLVLALPPFSGIGIVLYFALWFLMPVQDSRSGLDHLVDTVSRFASDPPRRPGPSAPRRPGRSSVDEELDGF